MNDKEFEHIWRDVYFYFHVKGCTKCREGFDKLIEHAREVHNRLPSK